MTAEFTAEESMALESIDKAAVAALLLDLLAVPSVTGTAAESELQHRLARQLDATRPRRRPVVAWTCPRCGPRPASPAPRRRATRHGAGRRPRAGDGDGPTLMLQGHVDVVPPGDLAQWEGDPFVPTGRPATSCTAAAPAT